MLKITNVLGVFALLLSLTTGCSQSATPPVADTSGKTTVPDAAYLLVEMPADSEGVGIARKSDSKAEEVTVVGLIGGSQKPFIDGIAAFTIVDPAVPYCGADEGCPTPWDYCCKSDQLKENSALVKIVDGDGVPVAKDARGLLGVKELSKIVVRGKAKRDEAGNLTILAEKVYVAKE